MQIEKKKEKTWHTVIFYLKKNIKKLEPICILLKALAVWFSRRPTLTKISWRRYTISTGCFFISGVRRGNPTDLTKIVDKNYFAIQRVSPPKKTIPSKKQCRPYMCFHDHYKYCGFWAFLSLSGQFGNFDYKFNDHKKCFFLRLVVSKPFNTLTICLFWQSDNTEITQ